MVNPDTRKSEDGELTCEVWYQKLLALHPEIAQASHQEFPVYEYWNHGSSTYWCGVSFLKSKEYRRIQWKNRKNTHGR